MMFFCEKAIIEPREIKLGLFQDNLHLSFSIELQLNIQIKKINYQDPFIRMYYVLKLHLVFQ